MTQTSDSSDSNSDSDFDVKLEEASAARSRIEATKKKRDEEIKALEVAFNKGVSDVRARIERSVAEHRARMTNAHATRLTRLIKAIEARDAKQEAIGERLRDLQQEFYNLGTQLKTLFDDRLEKASAATLDHRETPGGVSKKA